MTALILEGFTLNGRLLSAGGVSQGREALTVPNGADAQRILEVVGSQTPRAPAIHIARDGPPAK